MTVLRRLCSRRRLSIPATRRRRDSAATASKPDSTATTSSATRTTIASATRDAVSVGATLPQDLAWRRIDLHIHTPASVDYHQPGVSILDILHRAEERGLDAIALTDH